VYFFAIPFLLHSKHCSKETGTKTGQDHLASVALTRRAVVVDEGWRTGSLAAEVSARITEGAFWRLDAPVGRVCSVEVHIPYAAHLEQAAIPQVSAIVAAVRAAMGKG
jgi:2-oxoisovalerate dehydrogenase E1 component